jgi:hypothetical protein
MVDLTQLTQNQIYGLTYTMQAANAQITQENTHAEQWNASRPVNADPLPIKDLYTLQTWADKIAGAIFDNHYSQLLQYKQDVAIQKFYSASPEKQAQALAVLEVPDVVQ